MLTVPFWKATAERGTKTFAQAMLALIGTGAVGITSLDWPQMLSVAATAVVVSVLTSVASGATDGNPSAINAETTDPAGKHAA
ncbi:MAG: holin [Acidobacteria bacterium]|nr:holin [Acidobacteriota bacterium]